MYIFFVCWILYYECSSGVNKTHKLVYESVPDVPLANYNKEDFSNYWRAGPRVASQWLNHFVSSLEEISMLAGPPKDDAEDDAKGYIRLKSFTDPYAAPDPNNMIRKPLTTEIELDPREFDDFVIKYDTELTFSLKEFKARHCDIYLNIYLDDRAFWHTLKPSDIMFMLISITVEFPWCLR